jgi:endoglucanase
VDVLVGLAVGGWCVACGASTSSGADSLRVVGNRLVDSAGSPVVLRGVNFSGAEYACIQGDGIWDAPTDERAVQAMLGWKVNSVRIPLNEDCWLGLHVKRGLGGAAYRAEIHRFVARLRRHRLFVILDLHWSAPGSRRATKLLRMPDVDHSPAFWRSVARSFRGQHGVLFDLFNEPFGVSWRCWREGCRLPWRAAGMQRLVDAVRATGARQPLLVGGLDWANDLSRWLRFRPRDPARQLVASFHLYNFTECITPRCWQRTIASVARRFPVVTGELGEDDCRHRFIDRYMDWADQRAISYLAWSWNVTACGAGGPSLIRSTDGTPTQFGAGYRNHLIARSYLTPRTNPSPGFISHRPSPLVVANRQ